MASKRLLDKRREHEAAEKQGKTKGKTAKKATRKTATRKRKTKAPERKRLLWGVFSGTLKEEGRFAWDEKDKAEEKLALLRSKSKKLYFIQPIKEVLTDAAARPADEEVPSDEEETVEEVAVDEDEDGDDGDDDDGEEE